MRAQRTLIQGASVKPDTFRFDDYEEKFNLTGRAMVGLVINNRDIEYDVYKYENDMEEIFSLYFKLKIYACDDLESIINDWEYYHLSCRPERVQKCSRLIFVWTWRGRGIEFLDGHGIHFNVSFLISIFCYLLEVLTIQYCKMYYITVDKDWKFLE